MDKRQYLLKVLTQLEPVWNLAEGLKILVEEGNLGENTLDALIEAVQGAISISKSDLDKKKLEKGLEALQKMKNMEEDSKMQDEKDLEELDKIINSF